MKDIALEVLSEDRILRSVRSIKDASAQEIDVKEEIIKLPKLGFYKEEVSKIEEKLLQNNPEDGVVGKPTMWKLSQAITSVSNDIGDRRKREIDELAGKIISM